LVPAGRAGAVVVARLAMTTPAHTSTAPASCGKLGRSPSAAAASSRAAAGCKSSSSDDTAAGSLGSDEVISSQPAVWLAAASSVV
jgi:hypothetical protein